VSRNREVAALFDELADRLEAQDGSFRPRAYRNAADAIRQATAPIETLAAEGPEALEAIEGVGEATAAKVIEFLETGQIAALEEEREAVPVDMQALQRVEGLGPKRVYALYEALEITDLDELEAAADAGEIQTVEGFGPKTQATIREQIEFARTASARTPIGQVYPLAEDVIAHLRDHDAAEEVALAGSIRRWRATIGDIDVLVATETPDAITDHLVGWDRTGEVLQAGVTKTSVRVGGQQVDLRVVEPDSFGAALQYFTGSKAHNVRLRNRALDRGLTMNEYGTFELTDAEEEGARVAGETEASMYEAVGLPLIAPDLREDRGEIAAAAEQALPALLTPEDIRGDLHTHTTASDGRADIAAMLEAAADRGYDYYAVCDHASGPGVVANMGLDDAALLEHADAVREAADAVEMTVLTGVETNITADGELSTDDSTLEALDCVVASPHSALDQDRGAATERIIAAIEHPLVDIIGHPTGMRRSQREGLPIDIEAVASAAADAQTALEVNANPARLDLRSEFVRVAVEAGATIAIDTDAHGTDQLELMRYGVHTARRGWATADAVLNTWDAAAVMEFCH
jgi:DNA polymerase IV (family X)